MQALHCDHDICIPFIISMFTDVMLASKGAQEGCSTEAEIGHDKPTIDLGVNCKRMPAWLLPISAM